MVSIKRDQIWRRDVIENKLVGVLKSNDTSDPLTKYEMDLDRLIEMLQSLSGLESWHEQLGWEAKIVEIFREYKINPTVSRLRFLYGVLFEKFFEYWNAENRITEAQVFALLALQSDYNSEQLLDCMTHRFEQTQQYVVNSAHAQSSLNINYLKGDLKTVASLRLSGLFVEAKFCLDRMKSKSPDAEGDGDILFQNWMLECQIHGLTVNVQRQILAEPELLSNSLQFLKLFLLQLSSASREINLACLRHIERHLEKFKNQALSFNLIELILKFESNKISSWGLSYELAKIFPVVVDLKDAELELLFLLLWQRHCTRNNNRDLANLLTENYRARCSYYSQGTNDDLYHVLPVKFERRKTISVVDAKSLSDSSWGRVRSHVFLSYQLLKFLGKKKYRSLLSSSDTSSQLTAAERFELIKFLGNELQVLRGPVMKLGQTASYWGFDLTGAENEYLNTLQANAAPVPFEMILKVLREEWGDKLDQDIDYISPDPIGVGSIGQTHLVKTTSGHSMAVKIQFPDVKKIIRQDFMVFDLFLPIFSKIAPLAVIERFLRELKEMIELECDYVRELNCQKEFIETYKHRSDIKIASVHEEYSTSKVIAMEYIDGKNFQEFKESATKEEIDAAGATIAYFVVNSCVRGMFQSDNHPGNFKFLKGQVGFMDFGSVKKWEPHITKVWGDVIYASHKRDFAVFSKAIIAMCVSFGGKHNEIVRIYDALVLNSMKLIGEDIISKFTYETLHKEFFEFLSPQISAVWNMRPDKEFLFGFRVYFGLIALMSELGSECNWYQIVKGIYADRVPPQP